MSNLRKRKRILTIVGARPQFVKAAAVTRCLRLHADETLVHTGQHYDNNMSDVFFDELGIPFPNYNLDIGSGLHGAQTGAMLKALEEILLKETPDCVLVYGDTNSTLAGALAATKLHFPVAHVEAGLRSFNRWMPEEINRVLTDHIADTLFCPSETAITNLNNEGIFNGVHFIGDVMFEALMDARIKAEQYSTILSQLHLETGKFILATVHRAENTDDPDKIKRLIKSLAILSRQTPVVFPIHPRTKKQLMREGSVDEAVNLHILDPVGYLDMVHLEESASAILTDSGGIQKEAFWLKVPCVTLREETEWVETVQQGWNTLAGTDIDKIVQHALQPSKPNHHLDVYKGEGSVRRLIEILC
ncbi:UDP-N-acetylglucosamine 2-epimerase (non-hydrolyzing) [bacterium]|nr:UDP-N-acetylglucosamine 2-epimerase (non-hydrolyzing) [candidate division CSSED10-310 bacterium]